MGKASMAVLDGNEFRKKELEGTPVKETTSHDFAFVVSSNAGDSSRGKNRKVFPPMRINNCCDESEAKRIYLRHHKMSPSDSRVTVEDVPENAAIRQKHYEDRLERKRNYHKRAFGQLIEV